MLTNFPCLGSAIKIWSDESYPTDDEEWNLKEFAKFPFKLDNFQKYAIRAITMDENVLVTSQTGSGKTVCAEYAIYHALERGKKVIYTSPIKSLSNQKFNEFNRKFGSRGENLVGILTGDIKYNPDAPILIMTTEILRNLLYKDEIKVGNGGGDILKLDIKRDVAIVIFDEVHYINDKDRGKVWEESIILLPPEIVIVMLSATIDRAEEFGRWIQDIKGRPLNLVGNKKRVIPLKHYFYMTTKSLGNKRFSSMDAEERKYLESRTDKLVPILDENGKFYEENVQSIHKMLNNYRDLVDGPGGTINKMVEYLRDNEMMPAIFFIFSRVKCEQYAEMLNLSLNTTLEQNEVEKTIEYYMSKLENRDSYKKLEQFHRIKKLLMRGIGFHHSGLVPVFKEITEILFEKHLVKVLMATETFSVGLNMPTRTCVFVSLYKPDSGNKYRLLKTSELKQMNGRAGRRGKDSVGYVIHLTMDEYPSVSEVRQMMLGQPQPIVSKFSLNYQFILKAGVDLPNIINKSLWNREIDEKIVTLKGHIIKDCSGGGSGNGNNEKLSKKEIDECRTYEKLLNGTMEFGIKLSQNAIKTNRKQAQKMMGNSKFKAIYSQYQSIREEMDKKAEIKSDLEHMEKHISVELERITAMLAECGYMDAIKEPSLKGRCASLINQCHPLLLTEMIFQGVFEGLNAKEIAAVLSIFTDCKGATDEIEMPNEKIRAAVDWSERIANYLWNMEDKYCIHDSGGELEINRKMIGMAYNWVLNNTLPNSDIIFEGEFIKTMIEICRISEELEKIAEIIQNNNLKVIVAQIPELIMTGCVTADSLYIRGGSSSNKIG